MKEKIVNFFNFLINLQMNYFKNIYYKYNIIIHDFLQI